MSQFEFSVFSDNVVSHVRERPLVTDEILFSQGRSSECVYRVKSGSIRLVAFPDDGKQLVLYRAQTGEVFAEENLALETNSYTAIAEENSVVQFVCRIALLRDLCADPVVLQRYLSCIAVGIISYVRTSSVPQFPPRRRVCCIC